ncbi:MAG TPA: sortase [Candidatus Saccharimonadales bacterium]|jgi:LPXTG-site transpeptidase (sortase) family protein
MTPSQTSWLQRVRFYASGALLYVASIACIGFALHTPRVAASTVTLADKVTVTATSKIKLIAGRPVRIVIPSEDVDLPLIPGTYDRADDSWTLSGYEAQFATSSTPANNVGGETFIYGHNNDYVFGALRHVTPTAGAEALVYTNNHHIFAYKFQKTWSVGPYDVTTIDYQGPPVLLIQTCTGSFNQWRTMYLFDFKKVVQ